MTASDLARERLRNQKLAATSIRSAADVVGWLGAVQSQDYPGAAWGVAQRARGLTRADLDRGFDAGHIVRTHVMRPTWHFLAPEDLHWMQALTGARVRAMSRSIMRTLEIDAAVESRARRAFERALEGGRMLTRPELAAVLSKARIAASGQRLAYIVMAAELDAVICSGPRRGKQYTYALAAERAPHPRRLSGDEALSTLATRYFTSHGPATLRDFVWWSGLRVADARRAIDAARPGIAATVAGDLAYWRTKPRRTTAPGLSTFLLPNYDEYLVAYQDRALLGAATRLRAGGPVAIDIFAHFLIIDGLLAGTWRTTIGAADGVVTVTPHWRFTSAEARSVEAAVTRYAAFAGVPITLRWS